MPKSFNIILVVGARPNFIKIAPLVIELENKRLNVELVHTGQHWDEKLSNQIFDDLNLREPDIHLETPQGTMNSQLGFMIQKFDFHFANSDNDTIVGVVGDVTSTLAAAISAKNAGKFVFHIESGLRSRNLGMPEERNRIMVDQISDICFAPSKDAVQNLLNENVDKERISLVGNIMMDSLFKNIKKIELAYKKIKPMYGIDRDFFITTLHRDENIHKDNLKEIFTALNEFSENYDIILPAHPRLKKFVESESINIGKINFVDSLPYIEFLSLVMNAKVCLTDSGGLQEETSVLGIPCLTLREETERPITVELGTNTVVGTKKEDIIKSIKLLLKAGDYKKMKADLWDGNTSSRIVKELMERVNGKI